MGGLRAAMGYCGCATIDELRTRAEFVEITSAGIRGRVYESLATDYRAAPTVPAAS